MGKSNPKKRSNGSERHEGVVIRFEVSMYDRSDSSIQSMDRAQVMAMELKSYDCCRAKGLGVGGFRDPDSGDWVSFGEGASKGVIGPKAGKILEAIQLNPGVYLDPKTLFDLTGEESLLDGANLASRIHLLRKAFGETKETEHFILTSDGGVAWPQELTWVFVEIFIPAETNEAAVVGS